MTLPPSLRPPDWSVVMLAGGIAGIAAWSIGSPMDVIKSRMQMDGVRGTRRYRGLYHCAVETVRVEGVAVFVRTLSLNCIRAFPTNMVVFLTYEALMGFLTGRVVPPPFGVQ